MSNHTLTAESSLNDWLQYLETLHPTEIELGLERIKRVAVALNLQTPYIKITVGGTNGKGSTCAMLEAILLASGYKVGVYSSPHLLRYNERIRVNGTEVDDAHITQQFARINAARGDISLSYFEFATLAALLTFEVCNVQVAVLEVGLGGRLDAVNMVNTDCAILTNIDIDHVAYLGDTRDKVGFEKAHIFRANTPAICADPFPPAIIAEYAEKIGADLWQFGRDFNYNGDAQQWAFQGRGQRRSGLAYPSLRGVNQLLNASAVLAALTALRLTLPVTMQAIREGFHRATIAGRLQILPGDPTIVLDVAHNPHAAGTLAQNLDQMPCTGRTLAVVGMLNDKDAASVLRLLLDRVDAWYCAGLGHFPRGLSAGALYKLVQAAKSLGPMHAEQAKLDDKPGVRVEGRRTNYHNSGSAEYATPVEAFTQAFADAAPNDRILVFGSFATVGPVLAHLGRGA